MNKELEKDSNKELLADDHDNSSPNESGSESDSTDSCDSDSDYKCTDCNKKFSGPLPLRQHLRGSNHKKVLTKKKKEKKLMKEIEDVEEEDEDGQIVSEPYKICKTCDKEFSGLEPYQDHLKSKTHKQKVLHASILEKARNEDGELNIDKLKNLLLSKKAASRSSDVPDSSKEGHASSSKTDEDDLDEHDSEEYECKDCGKTFCGLIPFTQHLTSKTHAKQVRSKSLLDKLTSVIIGERTDVSSLAVEDDILVCKICSTAFSGPQSAMGHLKSQKHNKTLNKYLKKLEKKKKKASEPKEPDSELTRSEDNKASEGTDATVNLKFFSETSC